MTRRVEARAEQSLAYVSRFEASAKPKADPGPTKRLRACGHAHPYGFRLFDCYMVKYAGNRREAARMAASMAEADSVLLDLQRRQKFSIA